MKFWKAPTHREIQKIVSLLIRPQHYRYFFDHLQNPLWVAPLFKEGYFKKPPEMVKYVDNVIFRPWPESQYLAQMAKIDDMSIKEQVLDIILKIPETDNPYVIEDIIDASLSMPPEMTIQILPKAEKWTQLKYYNLVHKKLGDMISHLAKGGKVENALDLAKTLLRVIPYPEYNKKNLNGEKFKLSPEPRPKFAIYDYEEILKNNIPDLVKASGNLTLTLLCNLLDEAIILSFKNPEYKGSNDLSFIWRTAIESGTHHHYYDIKEPLVSSIRNIAEQIIREGQESILTIVEFLEKRNFIIFHRIALHILRIAKEENYELIRERLTDRKKFDDYKIRHEYALLLRDKFRILNEPDKNIIIKWIKDGPDLNEFSKKFKEEFKKEPTESDMQSRKEYWQLEKLSFFKREDLPDELQKNYDELLKRHGKPKHPDKPYYMEIIRGGISPKRAEELNRFSLEELISFLISWRPEKNDFLIGPNDLGNELEKAVSFQPERYANGALKFKGLDPTYIRAIISGLSNAVKQNKRINWDESLKLCKWVIIQQEEIKERKLRHRDLDPDWGWTKSEIARFLEIGFTTDTIPFELRKKCWDVLGPITDHPNPDIEYEQKYGGTNMDPVTLSLNVTRGSAMHTVIRYALWVRKNFEKSKTGKGKLKLGFKKMREIQKVLEKHLDIEIDPSLAIRAVYGQWFPWIVLLDKDWAEKNKEKVFPKGENLKSFRDVAWNAYIMFCPAYDAVFEIIKDKYREAIEFIGSEKINESYRGDPEEKLAEHLMVYYGRGKIKIGGEDEILIKFFEKADDVLRGKAMGFVGWSLGELKGPVSSKIIEKFKRLWEWRLRIVKESDNKILFNREMASFGRWFLSGKFDEEWLIENFKEALEIVDSLEYEDFWFDEIIKRLTEIAEKRPVDTVKLLSSIAKKKQSPWSIYHWKGDAKKLLSITVKSNNPESQNLSINLINWFGVKGLLEFRELL